MEMHQLRYLVAVAEESNFSRAAERCHVSQPSLSQQIHKLEDEVGQPLFDRLPRAVTLTEAGGRLLVYARRILASVKDAQSSVDECKGAAVGRIVVGAIPTIAPYVLPGLLREFQRCHPNAVVEMVEDVTERIARGVEDGTIDLGIVSNCQGSPHVHPQLIAREPLLAVVAEGHRFAKRRRIAWRDLKKENFLLLHDMHCLSGQVRHVCDDHGLRPEVVFQGEQLSTLIGMVAADLGVSLVPRMMVDATGNENCGCVFVRFSGVQPERELNLIRSPQRYQTRAAAGFAELVTKMLGA